MFWSVAMTEARCSVDANDREAGTWGLQVGCDRGAINRL
jgi:hypothetical protein